MSLDAAMFRAAQDEDDAFEEALAELRAGEKTGHWTWFVFPQLQGLGSSSMALRFALAGRDEAEQYLRDAVLRARLLEATEVVRDQLCHRGVPLLTLMGWEIDALKLVSSLTLFERVARALAEHVDDSEELTRLADASTEVLDEAARQGHARCAFTLRMT